MEVREKALEKLKEVEFVQNGENRITSMIENRPDWTYFKTKDLKITYSISIIKLLMK